ncbi:hypothetical protein CGLAMM_07195 [Acetobacteraceae bacterium EV16G]|uniref:Uncharacterized protein n=2 Tax=Sorlinia euscelidii TaxID=3081148 RepID=A0ABU7U4J5_9PROT
MMQPELTFQREVDVVRKDCRGDEPNVTRLEFGVRDRFAKMRDQYLKLLREKLGISSRS